MPQLLIPDIDDGALQRLRERASHHGRTAENEAKIILTQALQTTLANPWSVVDAIRAELASTGRDFGDSTELIREDRAR